MREHRWSIAFPHAAERVWAVMRGYDRWTEFAPMVIAVEVLYPGDAQGKGLLRRVIYRMPFGRTGAVLERVSDLVAAQAST